MQIVPLQPVANQILTIGLGNQSCQIEVRQSSRGLFLSLYVDDELIIAGVLCENLNRIVRSLYLGFSGDLMFDDTQGTSDPEYTGLGSRYQLGYLAPGELPAGQG